MNRGKKIEASLSTLVDLKAELFRKQEEAKRNRANNDNLDRSLKLTGKLKAALDAHDRRHSGLPVRGKNDRPLNRPQFEDDDGEERKALEASRKKLEEKAKLYDKLTSSSHVNDDDELYMVDFNRKVLNTELPKAAPVLPDVIEVDEESYKAKEVEEEWVEYTDSLGRSRKCLKKDLSEMKAMDLELQKRDTIPPPSSLLEDIAEEDIQPIAENPSSAQNGPLHYQNVQHNEIRNHGVGYYGFSVEEEERAKQLEQLNSLRNQTKEQRDRREKLKEQRKNALKERLKKVKQRKLMKTGEELPLSDSESSNEDEPDEKKTDVPLLVPEPKEDETPSTVRPWDRGKIGTRTVQPFKQASQRNWVEQKRSERPSEFAPPQFYSERDERVESMHKFFQQTQMNLTSEDPQDIPLP